MIDGNLQPSDSRPPGRCVSFSKRIHSWHLKTRDVKHAHLEFSVWHPRHRACAKLPRDVGAPSPSVFGVVFWPVASLAHNLCLLANMVIALKPDLMRLGLHRGTCGVEEFGTCLSAWEAKHTNFSRTRETEPLWSIPLLLLIMFGHGWGETHTNWMFPSLRITNFAPTAWARDWSAVFVVVCSWCCTSWYLKTYNLQCILVSKHQILWVIMHPWMSLRLRQATTFSFSNTAAAGNGWRPSKSGRHWVGSACRCLTRLAWLPSDCPKSLANRKRLSHVSETTIRIPIWKSEKIYLDSQRRFLFDSLYYQSYVTWKSNIKMATRIHWHFILGLSTNTYPGSTWITVK